MRGRVGGKEITVTIIKTSDGRRTRPFHTQRILNGFFVSFGPQPPELLGVREILPETDRQTGLRVQGLSDQMPQGVSRQSVSRVHQLENS